MLKDVSYGAVSAYIAVSPGQYTVAMRGFGAPASSKPALTTSFMVGAGAAYTLAALDPDPGLRTEVLKDQMATPAGKAVVRVLQASLKQHLVTVSYGPDILARQLAFGAATSYTAVSPGTRPCGYAPGQHTVMPVTLPAGTVHTIVVLDDSSGLKVDAVTDAVGSQIMPKGAISAGFGGTAPRPPNPAPWLVMITAGALLAVAGLPGCAAPRNHRFEQLTGDLDPASVAAEDRSGLRAIAEAAENRSTAMKPSPPPANRLFPQLIGIIRPRLRWPGATGSGPAHSPRITADGLMNRCPADRG